MDYLTEDEVVYVCVCGCLYLVNVQLLVDIVLQASLLHARQLRFDQVLNGVVPSNYL